MPMAYLDRDAALVSMTRGRTVLHLGCVGFADLTPDTAMTLAAQSLHWKLSSSANVVGIDHTEQNIKLYRDLGVFDNVIFGDVERLNEVDLQTTFDVIVAGDIIEHLSNPGMMLEGIKRFCNPSSRLLITTPNAHGLPNYLRFLGGRFSDGSHVLAFNVDTLANLLTRHGFAVERIYTCFEEAAKAKGGMLFRVGKAIITRIPKLGGTLLAIATPSFEHGRSRDQRLRESGEYNTQGAPGLPEAP